MGQGRHRVYRLQVRSPGDASAMRRVEFTGQGKHVRLCTFRLMPFGVLGTKGVEGDYSPFIEAGRGVIPWLMLQRQQPQTCSAGVYRQQRAGFQFLFHLPQRCNDFSTDCGWAEIR